MPGFTDTQLEQLERIIGQRAPQAYLDWLRRYPAELASLTYPKLTDRLGDYELLDDPEKVLQLNAMVREEDLWTDKDGDGPYPPNHLAIGEDMGGDIVSIQLDDPDLPVFRLHISIGELRRTADNLDAYAGQLRKKYGG